MILKKDLLKITNIADSSFPQMKQIDMIIQNTMIDTQKMYGNKMSEFLSCCNWFSAIGILEKLEVKDLVIWCDQMRMAGYEVELDTTKIDKMLLGIKVRWTKED